MRATPEGVFQGASQAFPGKLAAVGIGNVMNASQSGAEGLLQKVLGLFTYHSGDYRHWLDDNHVFVKQQHADGRGGKDGLEIVLFRLQRFFSIFAFGDVLKYRGKLARPHLERVDIVIELLLFDKLLEGDGLAGEGDFTVCFYERRALDMGIDLRDASAQHIRYAQPGVLFKGSVGLQEHIIDWFALCIDYDFMNGDAGQGIVKQAAKQRFAFMHTGKRLTELLLRLLAFAQVIIDSPVPAPQSP